MESNFYCIETYMCLHHVFFVYWEATEMRSKNKQTNKCTSTYNYAQFPVKNVKCNGTRFKFE